MLTFSTRTDDLGSMKLNNMAVASEWEEAASASIQSVATFWNAVPLPVANSRRRLSPLSDALWPSAAIRALLPTGSGYSSDNSRTRRMPFSGGSTKHKMHNRRAYKLESSLCIPCGRHWSITGSRMGMTRSANSGTPAKSSVSIRATRNQPSKVAGRAAISMMRSADCSGSRNDSALASSFSR